MIIAALGGIVSEQSRRNRPDRRFGHSPIDFAKEAVAVYRVTDCLANTPVRQWRPFAIEHEHPGLKLNGLENVYLVIVAFQLGQISQREVGDVVEVTAQE